MLVGLQLASISSLLIGAGRLKRAIQGAVRSAEDSGASATFQPLVDAIKVCRLARGHGCVMHMSVAVWFTYEVSKTTALACSCISVVHSQACHVTVTLHTCQVLQGAR